MNHFVRSLFTENTYSRSFLKKHFLIGVVLIIAFFLRFYELSNTMMFIGDIGWFYLSARDMILFSKIPLVGITSSHTWLHQGAFWTYLLSSVLFLFRFNPVSGAYLTGVLGVVTVLLMYLLGSELFGKPVGILAAFLYATSPLVVLHSRMPYHTSPIPFFALLFFYAVYQWIQGRLYWFPISLCFLAVLYNFELATSILWFFFGGVFIYGCIKKQKWIVKLKQKKIVFSSFFAVIIPMLPMLLYDISHGFPQTVRFVVWIIYSTVKITGLFGKFQPSGSSWSSFLSFTLIKNQTLLFLPNTWIACIFFIGIMVLLGIVSWRNKKIEYTLLLFYLVIVLAGYLAEKTPSEAYLPVFFPAIFFAFGIIIAQLYRRKILFFFTLFIIVMIAGINDSLLISEQFLTIRYGYGEQFQNRVSVAKQMVAEAKGKPFQIKGIGDQSQFSDFTDNYQYLTWWLGGKPVTYKTNLTFYYQEKNGFDRLLKMELVK